MEHDLCYDEEGEAGRVMCDNEFTSALESLDRKGVPAPHQIINAYNYFKKNKPYRNFNVTFKDLWDVNTVSCESDEGIPTLFCDVGRGRDNCEITMGLQSYGAPCYCDYPNLSTSVGVIPGGRFQGTQRTADDF